MILAVAGGKGGVGKTTLAYNVAAALDAVVVDADLGMPDLPSAAGPDLHDVLAGRACTLECVRGGPVDILPCGRSLAGARASDLSALDEALRPLEREFGTVVRDWLDGRLARSEALELAGGDEADFALATYVETHDPIPEVADAVAPGGSESYVTLEDGLGGSLETPDDLR